MPLFLFLFNHLHISLQDKDNTLKIHNYIKLDPATYHTACDKHHGCLEFVKIGLIVDSLINGDFF